MTHWPVLGAAPVSGTSQLVPETGQSVILFWCQKPAPVRACSISCRKPTGKLNCDWSVRAEDSTAPLFVNIHKR